MKGLMLNTEQHLEIKTGIEKKFFGQYNAFNELLIPVTAIFCKNFKIQIIARNSTTKKFSLPNNWLGFNLKYYFIACKELFILKPDFVFIRYPMTEVCFLLFLLLAKIKKTKIIIEFPTYPYDNEFKNKSFIKKCGLSIDIFFRRFLKHLNCYALTYTNYNPVLKLPALKIDNGLDLNYIKIKKNNNNESCINLLAVANISEWHGYDRVIKGMYHYYKQGGSIRVFFYIVGDGASINSIKNLAKELNLENHVFFTGAKSNSELSEFYDIAHIGIEVLGMHRRGYNEASSLKAREYCAIGLPFVSSAEDKDFSDFPYCFKVIADESPVNIQQIIDFYLKIKKNTGYSSIMNSFAKDNLTWTKKIQPVVENLLSADCSFK